MDNSNIKQTPRVGSTSRYIKDIILSYKEAKQAYDFELRGYEFNNLIRLQFKNRNDDSINSLFISEHGGPLKIRRIIERLNRFIANL